MEQAQHVCRSFLLLTTMVVVALMPELSSSADVPETTEETIGRISQTGFLSQWRVPFQAKVALSEINDPPGQDFSLHDLVRTANDTDDAQLNALGLSREQQAWAKNNTLLVGPVADGAVLGLRECHRRFKYERWNCPIHRSETFQKVFMIGGREAAFLYAIQAAGISLAVARTCSKGKTGGSCGCDKIWKQGGGSDIKPNASWSWGACSDNIHFAHTQTLNLLAGPNEENGDRAHQQMMERHNYRMGLEIAKDRMQFLCKCHGLTGSCVHKTCWFSVSKIQIIGRALMRRYGRSIKVAPDSAKQKLVPQDTERKVDIKDSLHLHQSPSYCDRDPVVGSLGTAGRECGQRRVKQSICPTLCCDRGSMPRRAVLHKQCNCRFEWCCRVRCDTCEEVEETYKCKR
ncbi:protein Wnt-7b-like [Sycon ciliatum]|uniref:Protein Wnt n=1 Tax=Sycon ciliatum TaxID=27933 RepID=A0A077SN22_9METZ|nr:Wnt R SciWntR [Sycon ciliatum]